MNVTTATQTAGRDPVRPITLADPVRGHSAPQGPRTGRPEAIGSPADARETATAGRRRPRAARPTGFASERPTALHGPSTAPAAANWTGAFPTRPGAPLVLPGATLAEALGGHPHRKAPVLDPALAVLLPLLAADLTQAEIAARLHLSKDAVKHRAGRLYAALGVSDRVGAVAEALACGLIAGNPKET